MFLLGLLLPLVFIPGYTGVSIPTQWAFLGVALLPVLWRSGPLSVVPWPGLAFLAFAVVSMAWTLDFGFGLWAAVIWGLSFWYGWTSPNLLSLWRGLAIGLSVSSVVAVFQALGFQPVFAQGPAGLLFNTGVLGACVALVTIALICHEQWAFIPGLFPALWFAHSRAAWAIVILAMVAKYVHWTAAVIVLGIGGALIYLHQGSSDFLRLQFWQMALHNLTVFGHGVGSFNSIYTWYDGRPFHPENVHNDYLQLLFEFGIFGLIPVIGLAFALGRTEAKDWPVLVAIAALGLVYFPLWSPIPAFIGCAVAGHILRYYGAGVGVQRRGRSDFISWRDGWGLVND